MGVIVVDIHDGEIDIRFQRSDRQPVSTGPAEGGRS
jgi:hypothetical protein